MKTNRKKKAAIVRGILRKDYLTFARKVFLTVCGEEPSSDPYIWVVCKAALDVHEGRVRRLVLSLPPRHGKTILFTICLVAWELAQRPWAKVIVICYGQDLARFISDKVRDVLGASWFRRAFPETLLREDHNRARDFATTAGGAVYANHLGPGITGHGADLIILDDPHDIQDAKTPHRLVEANETFDSVVPNRLNHPKSGRIVIVGHRIHSIDLSGHLLREVGWTHVKLPFVAERDETYKTPYGKWHRRKGELLRAGEYGYADVEVLRGRMVVPSFETLYQQSPAEASWRLAPEDFPLYGVVPARAGGVVISVDAGHVPGERNSFSVFQAWRSTGTCHYLIDQWRDKVTPTDLLKAMRSFIRRHRPSAVLIERASAGISLLAALEARSRREGFSLEAIPTGNRSKFERFSDVVPIITTRSVYLPAGELWTYDFIDEVTSFPDSAADDQVDAMAQYLAWKVKYSQVPLRPPRAMGNFQSSGGGTLVAGQTGGSFYWPRSRYFFSRNL